jgi:hypothetical protein
MALARQCTPHPQRSAANGQVWGNLLDPSLDTQEVQRGVSRLTGAPRAAVLLCGCNPALTLHGGRDLNAD